MATSIRSRSSQRRPREEQQTTVCITKLPHSLLFSLSFFSFSNFFIILTVSALVFALSSKCMQLGASIGHSTLVYMQMSCHILCAHSSPANLPCYLSDPAFFCLPCHCSLRFLCNLGGFKVNQTLPLAIGLLLSCQSCSTVFSW